MIRIAVETDIFGLDTVLRSNFALFVVFFSDQTYAFRAENVPFKGQKYVHTASMARPPQLLKNPRTRKSSKA